MSRRLAPLWTIDPDVMVDDHLDRPTAAAPSPRRRNSRFFHPDLLFGLRVTQRSGSVKGDFGRRVGNSQNAIFKRVSCCSDTENRNSGARGDCHSVPYSSLWTRHFFYFFLNFPVAFYKPGRALWLRTRWYGVRFSPGAPTKERSSS